MSAGGNHPIQLTVGSIALHIVSCLFSLKTHTTTIKDTSQKAEIFDTTLLNVEKSRAREIS